MYHCHIQIYFIGGQRGIFETVKAMPPLEHFTHAFVESARPQPDLLAQSDVILADVQGMDGAGALAALSSGMKNTAELIVLAGREQVQTLADAGAKVRDIWAVPMSEGEVRFRFLRWQQGFRLSKDYWEANHFLDACIDGSPNMVWYKDKEGVHRKVNNSFCKTVSKTKKQVEGRDHAYIWDVEEDDPACLVSELEVMSKRKTCISEEIVQTSEGEMELTTYKSPLFDLDGSVMGTVVSAST